MNQNYPNNQYSSSYSQSMVYQTNVISFSQNGYYNHQPFSYNENINNNYNPFYNLNDNNYNNQTNSFYQISNQNVPSFHNNSIDGIGNNNINTSSNNFDYNNANNINNPTANTVINPFFTQDMPMNQNYGSSSIETCDLLKPLFQPFLPNFQKQQYKTDPITPKITIFPEIQSPGANDIPKKLLEQRRIFLERKDLNTLRGRRWLSDGVVNSYLDHLHNKYRNPTVGHTNTFFYEKLTKQGPYEASQWAGIYGNKVNIFKHFLIPIYTGNHWFLIDLDFKQNQMNILDSYSHKRDKYITKINNFLKYQGINPLHPIYPKVPKQSNSYDCGAFLLHFALIIFKNDGPITILSFKANAMPSFRKKVMEDLKQYVPK